MQTAALSGKLVELAELLAERDAKLAELNDFVKNRWERKPHRWISGWSVFVLFFLARVLFYVDFLLRGGGAYPPLPHCQQR